MVTNSDKLQSVYDDFLVKLNDLRRQRSQIIEQIFARAEKEKTTGARKKLKNK